MYCLGVCGYTYDGAGSIIMMGDCSTTLLNLEICAIKVLLRIKGLKVTRVN